MLSRSPFPLQSAHSCGKISDATADGCHQNTIAWNYCSASWSEGLTLSYTVPVRFTYFSWQPKSSHLKCFTLSARKNFFKTKKEKQKGNNIINDVGQVLNNDM